MTLVTHLSSVNLKKKKVAPGYLMSYCRKKCHIEGRGKLMASCHPYGTFFFHRQRFYSFNNLSGHCTGDTGPKTNDRRVMSQTTP